MENFDKIKELILDAEKDAIKLYEKGNVAAGKRIRKVMQEVKKIAQAIRIEAINIKNSKSESAD